MRIRTKNWKPNKVPGLIFDLSTLVTGNNDAFSSSESVS